VDDTQSAPIHPQLADDALLARLDAFVVGLGEAIDGMQDAEHAGQLDEVAKRAADLAREATALGLPPLAQAAETVVAACRSGASHAPREAIVALTDVVRRVRMGHRSPLS
jgi:hypothetical protein